MEREYFCVACGLFYWKGLNKSSICPNEFCKSKINPNLMMVYACDTTGWYYFSEKNGEFINSVAWSSRMFSPQFAIDVYKNLGYHIKDE